VVWGDRRARRPPPSAASSLEISRPSLIVTAGDGRCLRLGGGSGRTASSRRASPRRDRASPRRHPQAGKPDADGQPARRPRALTSNASWSFPVDGCAPGRPPGGSTIEPGREHIIAQTRDQRSWSGSRPRKLGGPRRGDGAERHVGWARPTVLPAQRETVGRAHPTRRPRTAPARGGRRAWVGLDPALGVDVLV
jgi:hypothetical protein